MFRKNHLVVLIALILGVPCFSQPEILSIVPDSGYPGESLHVIIRGYQTGFQEGQSVATFGPGVSVQSFHVTDGQTGTAFIEIDAAASPGFCDVSVQTGGQIVYMEQGFEILEPGADVTVRVQVIPVEVLYLADFDPMHLASAPLLFTVTLFNDTRARDLSFRLEITGDTYGPIVQAFKSLPAVEASGVRTVTNRDFDDYNTTVAGDQVIEIATQTGLLPVDIYRYRVCAYENDLQIDCDEDENTTTNPVSDLELIGPGAPFGEAPEDLFTSNPLFQWFGGTGPFHLALYPVQPGQNAPEEVIENRPVFEESELFGTSYLYPESAEILAPDQVYAWQVRSKIVSSAGDVWISSEVYRFRVEDLFHDSGDLPVRIEVSPAEIRTETGRTVQFSASAFNDSDEPAESVVTWQVIPSEAGWIEASGLFHAGTRPMTAAVVARTGSVQEYGTVTIVWKMEEFDMGRFMKELFGLPDSEAE